MVRQAHHERVSRDFGKTLLTRQGNRVFNIYNMNWRIAF